MTRELRHVDELSFYGHTCLGPVTWSMGLHYRHCLLPWQQHTYLLTIIKATATEPFRLCGKEIENIEGWLPCRGSGTLFPQAVPE